MLLCQRERQYAGDVEIPHQEKETRLEVSDDFVPQLPLAGARGLRGRRRGRLGGGGGGVALRGRLVAPRSFCRGAAASRRESAPVRRRRLGLGLAVPLLLLRLRGRGSALVVLRGTLPPGALNRHILALVLLILLVVVVLLVVGHVLVVREGDVLLGDGLHDVGVAHLLLSKSREKVGPSNELRRSQRTQSLRETPAGSEGGEARTRSFVAR